MASTPFDIRYDRTVDDEFLDHFLPGGVADSLVPMARDAAFPLDVCMRRSPKTGEQWATIYAGLTAVLNIRKRPRGFRLDAHDTWSKPSRYGFRKGWRDLTPVELAEEWGAVELYLERVIPPAVRAHGTTEGAVQAAVSSSTSSGGRFMLDREVTPSFCNAAYKSEVVKSLYEPIVEALPTDLGAGKVPAKFGTECDLLAVDNQGHLSAIEVKPFDGAGVAWVAAQATMYALLLGRWLEKDPEAVITLRRMVRQRHQLRCAPGPLPEVSDKPSVIPVVAVQRGVSPTNRDRMLAVRDALKSAGLPPVTVLVVSIGGTMTAL